MSHHPASAMKSASYLASSVGLITTRSSPDFITDTSVPGVMIVAMSLYVIWWYFDNKRSLKQEEERLRQLRVQGVVPSGEKMEGERRG